MMKTCNVCGKPIALGNARCPEHRIRKVSRDRTYRSMAAIIANSATHCGICGQPFQPGERRVTDHIIPRAHGGSDSVDNLQAAHAHCNGAKSATLPSSARW